MSRPRAGHPGLTLGCLVLLTAACSGGPGPSVSSSGGATSSGGAASGGAMASSGGVPGSGGQAGGAGGAPAASCDEVPQPLRASGTLVEFSFDLVYIGQAFVYGEPNAGPSGATIVPLNVRFFVSQVALSRAGADPLPVDIVSDAGVPQPYGIHLFNAEERATTTLRVLAPAGAYTGLTFLLGLTDACNSGNSSRRSPLNDASQMYWGFPLGYLFLRYEGRDTPAGQADLPPVEIHMGGVPGILFAPRMRLDGALTIPSAGAGPYRKGIRVVMEQIFLGATTETDPPLGDPGARLEMNAGHLPLFTFGS